MLSNVRIYYLNFCQVQSMSRPSYILLDKRKNLQSRPVGSGVRLGCKTTRYSNSKPSEIEKIVQAELNVDQ